jgi:hypothetical protein
VVDVILTETTALGARWDAVERRVLDRRGDTVETAWGPVSVKLGSLGGRVVMMVVPDAGRGAHGPGKLIGSSGSVKIRTARASLTPPPSSGRRGSCRPWT